MSTDQVCRGLKAVLILLAQSLLGQRKFPRKLADGPAHHYVRLGAPGSVYLIALGCYAHRPSQ